MSREESECPAQSLNGYQRHELQNWLQANDIHMPGLQTVCPDGVVVAKLLEKVLPQLATKLECKRTESVRQRIRNWETLNAKVLHKVGMPQSREQLKLYVNGNQNALELLLYELMEHCESVRIRQLAVAERDRRKRLRFKSNQITEHKVMQFTEGRSSEVTKRFLPYAHYAQACADHEAASDHYTAIQLKNDALQIKLDEYSEEMNRLSQELASKTVASIFEMCKTKSTK